MQGKIINGFTIQRRLGVGGMAEVWYAENEIGKPAAVKILNEELSHNAQIVERFRNEAVVMVKLDHPYIRQVYGYGTIDDRPCIVMEYLEGDDLKAMMKQGRHFTNDELVKWWNQLVDALNYTHAQGIVHRDIKPSNIFLDKKDNIKLLDFGIAKIRESISMTQTGATMGTLMYMSPEQVEDSKHLGPESDNYSLAVSFVHLLTGKAPYDSTTSSDYAIRKGIVEVPLDISTVPEVWRGFLTPYLAKKPEERPVLRAFEPIVTGAPVQPTEPEDEGTVVTDTPKKQELPKQEPKKTEPKPATEPKPNDNKPKSKKVFWIVLTAAAVAVIVAVLFLSRHNTANGHEYVDLGLPSGTLWATCNVGADKPEDYGDYYAWGETKTKTTYNWDTYKYANGSYDKLTKYCNNFDYGYNGFTDYLTTLQANDDPATANWGSDWCTPTYEQWEELLQNTTSQCTTQHGVRGYLFTAKNGQTLFLPYAGGYWEGGYDGGDGGYWSGTLWDGPAQAWLFGYDSHGYGMEEFPRSDGTPIRPVRKK